MSKKRKSPRGESNKGEGAPAWMATFSDLMTLLLTFFILLYSISSVDAEKFKEISQSLQSVLSGEASNTIIEEQGPKDELPLDQVVDEDIIEEEDVEIELSESILLMYSQVQEYVKDEGLDAEVTVSLNKRGIFVNITEAILFESGDAVIKESGKALLAKLEGLFLSFENEIVVEGYTDNVPHHSTNFDSNWELSAGRATAVARYLSEEKGISGKRLSALGHGEYKPVVPNDSNKNRALNRRVNILIIMEEGT